MASTTGIEIGSESCTLVDVRLGTAGTAVVREIRLIGPNEWPAHDITQANLLQSIRRSKRLSRRAGVVAWTLPGEAVDDASARAALRFIESAGFRIDSILTPPQALARLARTCRRPGSPDATVWTALNVHGAAIAIVRGRDLLFARTFSWKYTRGLMESKAQLLQRYSLIAHLAPEVRHGIERVRASHGVTVDGVVTCGDLPELRSLTMPLIEELDLEVETLDSTEGLRAAGKVTDERLGEAAPAIRLACAAALRGSEAEFIYGGRAMRKREPSGLMRAAAAIALVGALAWGVFSFRNILLSAPVRPISAPQRSMSSPLPIPPDAGSTPAASSLPQTERSLSAPKLERRSTPQASDERNAPTPVSTVLSVRADPRPQAPVPVERPAAAVPVKPSSPPRSAPERQTSPSPNATSSVPSAATKRSATAAPAPLKEPLPAVDSILIDQERRLALIDGSIVGIGDSVGSRTIVQIERNAVILREPSGLVVRASVRSKRAS